ncbi:MAG: polysaccharide deacetylase family protein [Actinomycetes bacterium]
MRETVKIALARGVPTMVPPSGATLLIYHRVGGGSPDERDLGVVDFGRQLDVLARHDVVSLDAALDRLDGGDRRPSVVLTFDDGFADVHENAWPLLRDRGIPFTLYLATAYLGGTMHWEGSTARADGPALSWGQVAEMVDSGLCTVGNHTDRHVRPESLTAAELDECTAAIERNVGVRPKHFAFPWGIPVPARQADLRARFRSACTGELGRNQPGTDRMRLRRLPVRRTDPLPFFTAKLRGLGPERAYATLVRGAKAVGARA